MQYKRNEVKEAAREMLRGVWTALPTNFIDAERLDEKGIASNLEHSITHLKIDGHYCIGNVGEFWAMTNEERMRVVEINVDVNKGRVPLIAGCHHQNPLEAARLAKHAQDVGIDFVIILTPYMAARGDDAVYDYYKFVADRVDIGICLFNTNQGHPLSAKLAARLATIPNICGYKQGVSGMAAATSLRDTVGNLMEVSVAEEAPWLYNIAVCGDHWLLNYCPHLYQVPGYLPVRDYTLAAQSGDMNKAVEICKSINPLRSTLGRWIPGYGSSNRMAIAEQKYWMELVGMAGGPVRAPCAEMTEENKKAMKADLEATGLVAKAKAGLAAAAPQKRAA